MCGAPVATEYHAAYVCDLALAMLAECSKLKDPLGDKRSSLNTKMGMYGDYTEPLKVEYRHFM